MTRLRFLGATGTVTGSKYLVEHGGASLLVDCGLFQGFKPLRLRNWAALPVDPASLQAVVLTHAHLDHSGYLPLLVRNGFRGEVRCTEATFELCRILLADSAWLQEEQAEHANRYGWSKHKPALPLYTRADAQAALARFKPVRFHDTFEPCAGVKARFTRAGHILGAASVTLRMDGGTLAFSGDLGRPHDPVMHAPETLDEADWLVAESTYGDRLHEATDSVAMIGRVVTRAVSRGGSVIVPSFAVGRTQSMLLYFHRLRASGGIPKAVQVYLDSPMGTDVTRVYLRFREDHRLGAAECRALASVARIVSTPDESRALDQTDWPKVIIAGSGMAAGGRVLHHIKRYGPDPRSLILFTGFQVGGTRGEAMVRGAAEVKIHGEQVPIRAKVHNFENLSAHADRDELVAWLRAFKRAPRRVFLTHGEPAAADALRRRIADTLGWQAEAPEHLATVELA